MDCNRGRSSRTPDHGNHGNRRYGRRQRCGNLLRAGSLLYGRKVVWRGQGTRGWNLTRITVASAGRLGIFLTRPANTQSELEMKMLKTSKLLSPILCCALLVGCAVGP